MPGPELVEQLDRLEVRSPLRAGVRVLLGLLALVPLLAPYELLIRVRWEHHLNPFFILAALVAAGAMAVSALLAFAALAGLSSRLVLDRRAGVLSYMFRAPIVRGARRTYPLSGIRSVEVGVCDWSDGGPSYRLRVELADGTALESGSSWSREEIEVIRDRVDRFLGEARA